MRLRRLCLEIFAFRRFFREPINVDQHAGFPERNASTGCGCLQQTSSLTCILAERLVQNRNVLVRLHLPENC